MKGVQGGGGAESVLVSAVVRVRGPAGAIGGAGFLVAPELVLTCAHVVSDALERDRAETVEPGTEVRLDLPLAWSAGAGDRDGAPWSAEVQHWVPIRPDQTGDIAVLRLRQPIPGALPLPLADPRDGVWDHRARAVGFTREAPDGIWQSGTFMGPTGKGWVQLSRAHGEAVHVEGGFSGSPVWDDELGAAVGMMVVAQPVREAQQAFALRTRTLVSEVPELAPVVDPASPFRGLEPFQESDADVYFGRDDDIERVVTALRGERHAVTVYGPSGCGKSSLALAGAVPRMRRDGYLVLRVNATDVTSARAALATELTEIARSGAYGPPRARNAAEVQAWLADGGLVDTVHRVLGPTAGRLLVVLDQAEALLDGSPAVAEEAARLLSPPSRHSRLRVLITLRADFVGAALNHAHFGSLLKEGVTVPLAPMSRDQLTAVIGEPVERVPAVAYDTGLERRILDDAGGEPGVLPLLGFVLSELWRLKAGGRLLTSVYEEMGGVSGALRRRAEQAWEECVGRKDGAGPAADAEGRTEEALRLLSGLVRVLPGSEAPLRRRLTREEAGEERWRIAEALAERRLLVLRGDPGEAQSVELAHEALISAWPTLAHQVAADEEFLVGRAELGHDLDRWRKADRSPDFLPDGLHLRNLRHRLRDREAELTPEERDFLGRAQRRERARRTGRRVKWTAVTLAFALFVGLGTFLLHQSRVGAQQEAEGRSRSLSLLSDQLAQQDPVKAALIAMAAYDVSPTQEARSALLRRYDRSKQDAWVLSGTEGEIADVAASRDGRVVLAGSEQGRATLFLRTAGGRVLREHLRLPELISSPLVSGDGRRIAYTTTDGHLYWREVRAPVDGRTPLLGPVSRIADRTFGHGGATEAMDLSRDGRQVATKSYGGEVRVWDLRTKRSRRMPGLLPHTTGIRFGAGTDTLLVSRRTPTADGASVAAVDLRTGAVRELAKGIFHEGGGVLRTSGDGSVVVVCRERGKAGHGAQYRSLRVADGRELNRYDQKDGSCGSVAVDVTGERFAARTASGRWALVPNRPGARATHFTGPEKPEMMVEGLLGAPGAPTVLTWGGNAVTGVVLTRSQTTDASLITNHPVLLDGDLAVVRLGTADADGRTLRENRLAVVGPEGDVVSETALPARDVPAWSNPGFQQNVLAVNEPGTLAANAVGPGKVRIHELPSLKKLADITTAPPPTGGDQDPLSLRFTGDGEELVTLSGDRVEHWHPRDGRRLSPPLDLDGAALTGKESSGFSVGPYPEPGQVTVMAEGTPVSYVVDLRTGEELRELRLRLGTDITSIVRINGGRYAAAYARGGMVELWSAPPGRPPERTVSSLGPLNSGRWTAGVAKDGPRFILANGNTVRFQSVQDPGRFESYDFGKEQEFLAMSRNGRTLLRSVDGSTDVIRLDPSLWKRHLCAVVGRDLTPDERQGLPHDLPERICA
ncbi:nSTAND1 domain-containing NTPase [Streptomyces anulatus]|uniref:nSTAND1 domain-containing NTPase n=1 Tax=Streptomyces anulatus TaxID=1892 RepID=UPI0036BE8C8A